jgi:hypothetical protein
VDHVIRTLLRPWREAATWWALTFALLSVCVGTVTFTVVVTLLSLSVALLVMFPVALPFAWLLFWSARTFARIERTRIAALLEVDLGDPVPPLQAGTSWQRLVERVRSRPRWREIAYSLLLLPLGLLNLGVVLAVWCGSAALAALPLYVGHLPGDTAKFGLFEVSQGLGSAAAALVGIGGLVLVAPAAPPRSTALRPSGGA